MTKITDVLSKQDLKRFYARSDLRGAWMVGVTWATTIGILAVMAIWPHPLTIIAGWVLLAGRFLAMAVIMHDCGHHSMFRTPWLNDFCGQWLGGAPIFVDVHIYSRFHLKHHRDAGTPDDPDLGNYKNYAVTKQSMRRKILRDLTGRTALRTLIGIYLKLGPKVFVRPIVFHALFFTALYLVGHPWLYAVWMFAYFTSYMVIVRIRNAAEHAVVPDPNDPDPRRNTRTTKASWWERMIVAPNYVNYHLEHHLLPAVPAYRLKALHATLAEHNFYENSDISPGYIDVFRRLMRPTATN